MHEDCTEITDPKERKKLLGRFGRCFKCVKKGHRARDCRIKLTCKRCTGEHHTSLCMHDVQIPEGSGVAENQAASAPNSMHVGTGGRVALQTAQALLKGKGERRVRVLFDSASHKSFVTERTVQSIGLELLRREWLAVSTFGGKSTDSKLRGVAALELTPVGGGGGGEDFCVEAFVVPDISNIQNEHLEIARKEYPHLRGLWLSDVCRNEESLEIDVLIGADCLWRFQTGRTIRGETDDPVAVETRLGWVLSGPLKGRDLVSNKETSVNFVASESVMPDKSGLDNAVHKLWDLDSLGIKESDEVHEAFVDNISFNGQRYSVKLPWKVGHATLPTNYDNSLSRLKGQLKRLTKEPEVLTEYDSVIREQLASGVIERVIELDSAEGVHYLPHQAVIRREAQTTKLRIVYDASAKVSKNGTALNDCLHVGPSLNPLLIDILLRFRENRVALVGDIEKAFLNIEVDERDRDYLRFLWIDNVGEKSGNVDVYRFCRVVFGLNASPFLLNGTIRHHLATYEREDPGFVQKMMNGFYVDDLVTGETTVSKAYALFEKAKDRMACGGFKLRKWLTNNPELREKIHSREKNVSTGKLNVNRFEDIETFAKATLTTHGSPKGQKVLGLAWNCETDTINFDLTHIGDKAKGVQPTKRSVLSLLAGLFDPLGIFSPVTVSMKILFQELCSTKVDWDEVLSGEAKRKWERWVEDLTKARNIRISRCIYDSPGERVTECFLHGFGDASKRAYCAVVYLVYQTDNGSRHVKLLASKTRVAPLKELTIPRLELMLARILAQLMATVRRALQPQLEVGGVKYWLDSKTALCWIQNRGEWKQFVRHRVNEILQLTNKRDWKHCPGKDNPADLGSRGSLASVLKEEKLWWDGPEWLSRQPSEWPVTEKEVQTPESREEEKMTVTAMVVEAKQTRSIASVQDINRCSSFQKHVRVTVWVKRFVSNLTAQVKNKEKRRGMLDITELKEAERDWVKVAQTELKKQGNFKQLVSELGIADDTAILRCGGRLVNSDKEFDARRPIILPRDHTVTKLIIIDCHTRVHHSGVRATLAELRSRYWVPKGRQIVKKVVGVCVTCRKLIGRAYRTPPAAALPDFRVTESPPFSKVGVDFAGPLYTKEAEGTNKVYIALFSCCATRAVHLELVADLSAATFRRCLRKFTARRGTPTLIVSDNAKTFQATERALNELFSHPEIRAELDTRRIEWRFNLERAPWWGRFFERMVGSVKGCLRKVLGNARLTFDELLTVLVEVEATLNCRPLTYEYNEADEEVSTPSHLICGRRINSLPDEISEPADMVESGESSCSERFRYLTIRLEHFWNRWRNEYLADLREFHRGKASKEGRTRGRSDSA